MSDVRDFIIERTARERREILSNLKDGYVDEEEGMIDRGGAFEYLQEEGLDVREAAGLIALYEDALGVKPDPNKRAMRRLEMGPESEIDRLQGYTEQQLEELLDALDVEEISYIEE